MKIRLGNGIQVLMKREKVTFYVLWYGPLGGGWVLKMKKVDYALTWNDEGKYDISEHIKHFPGDDKIVNYGLIDNMVVKFDYGSWCYLFYFLIYYQRL